MTEGETMWLAGLLEGEGCFHLRKPQSDRQRPCAGITMKMTDLDVIERAAVLMDAPSVKEQKWYSANGHSAQYRCGIYGAKAEKVMRAVLPYMGARRAAKINEILNEELSHQ